jgi:hypothetical protein
MKGGNAFDHLVDLMESFEADGFRRTDLQIYVGKEVYREFREHTVARATAERAVPRRQQSITRNTTPDEYHLRTANIHDNVYGSTVIHAPEIPPRRIVGIAEESFIPSPDKTPDGPLLRDARGVREITLGGIKQGEDPEGSCVVCGEQPSADDAWI